MELDSKELLLHGGTRWPPQDRADRTGYRAHGASSDNAAWLMSIGGTRIFRGEVCSLLSQLVEHASRACFTFPEKVPGMRSWRLPCIKFMHWALNPPLFGVPIHINEQYSVDVLVICSTARLATSGMTSGRTEAARVW